MEARIIDDGLSASVAKVSAMATGWKVPSPRPRSTPDVVITSGTPSPLTSPSASGARVPIWSSGRAAPGAVDGLRVAETW